MNEELEILIPQYAMNKSELDGYKKICDNENARIKELMLQLELNEAEAGGYVAKRTVSKRESMNEEMLLEIAHQYGIPEIVKTKEYIDFDALENAIYNGHISKEVLEVIGTARETKEVITLKVTKVKRKEK